MVKIAIIYYSSTGHNHALARAAAGGAEAAGATIRIRKARELAPDEVIDSRPGWRAHLDATQDIPEAQPEDLDWADGMVFGTPTRFGLPAAQMKQFIDQCSAVWASGKLQDKPVSMFGGAGNLHGGQESTLLALANTFYHWGCTIVPNGYTHDSFKAAGGNPYGLSYLAGPDGPSDKVLAAAHAQGERIVRFAKAMAPLRAT